MKKISINLPSEYLSNCSFRDKIDVIRLSINYAKYAPIIYNKDKNEEGKERVEGRESNTILLIDKMKRLFVKYDNSIHSMHYPFNLIYENEQISFYYQDSELDAKTTSIMLNFFSGFDELESMEDMYENFLRVLDEYGIKDSAKENSLWKVICHLLVFEPGYLRYDEDFTPGRMDTKNHPPYHFDINYCNSTTFKLGIERKISIEEYIDVLDNSKERKFVKV